jgi:DNA-binding transcriptional LysR family regulator
MEVGAMEPKRPIGHRLKLRDLNIFIAVAKERSMSKAAAQLAVSQPAVSKAIADMEYTLRVPLLDRGPRGVEPTLYGQALLKRSVVIFDELRQSVTDIEALLDPTTGEARIGSSQAEATSFVPTVIERLTHRHPRLSFHVVEGSLSALQRDLRERSIELLIGVALTPIVAEDMETEVLFSDRHLVVAGSQNKWVGRRKIKIAELLDEPWIFPPPGSIPASLVSAAFLDTGVKVPRATVSAFSLPMHIFLLAAGRYLALLPESTVCYFAEHLPIKVLPVDLKTRPRPVVIVTMKGRTLSPTAQRFIECAREIAKPLSKRHTN